MCGILGIVGKHDVAPEAFGGALDTLAPRGPDDRGVYESPECLLGHRRLAILDLSSAGHQPMAGADGRYQIVFNGEVFNYRELRRPLEEEGVRFHSDSDTEVILALYARKGPACLEAFRGMFALAIWDTQERSLFLARDRMGIKPLYLWQTPHTIAFASEVRALRALPGGPRAISPAAVRKYLLWGSVPSPFTLLEGIESLPPATWGIWRDGRFETQEYWRLPEGSPTITERGEALETLRPILQESVALRCISDAPLGAFLSGGVDSSSIVSLMRSSGHHDLRTFSISFPQVEYDEGPHALRIADQFGTLHTHIAVTESIVRGELDAFFSATDQPTCDGVNTFLISKFARQGGLTVALSGLGGDEVFSGYRHLRSIARLSPWVKRFPRLVSWAAAPWVKHLHPRFAKIEAMALPGTEYQRLYFGRRGLFMPSQATKLMGPEATGDALAALRAHAELYEASGWGSGPLFRKDFAKTRMSGLHHVMHLEIRRYLHNQLLRDSDVFGMAHGLEIRVPFLDHLLVETAFRVSPQLLLEGDPKGLLLDALPTPLPRECTHRPKMGFTFPFDTWMRGPWKTMMEDGLLSPLAAADPFLQPEAVHKVWRGYLEGKLHWSRPWSLLALRKRLASA